MVKKREISPVLRKWSKLPNGSKEEEIKCNAFVAFIHVFSIRFLDNRFGTVVGF
jgi:hypothetical protein